jgi:hypothetical protein
MSKYGTFVGKGYESGGLFRLSLVDTLPLAVNNVINNVNVEMNVWHSRLCHVNFEQQWVQRYGFGELMAKKWQEFRGLVYQQVAWSD